MNKIISQLKKEFNDYFNRSNYNLILWFDPKNEWENFVKKLKNEFKIISSEEERSLFKVKYLLEMNPEFSEQEKKIIYFNIDLKEDKILEEYHYLGYIYKEDLFNFLENIIGVNFPKEKEKRNKIKKGIAALANESLKATEDFWEKKFGITSPADLFFEDFENMLIEILKNPESEINLLERENRMEQFIDKLNFDYGFDKIIELSAEFPFNFLSHLLFIQLFIELEQPNDFPLKDHLPHENKFKNCISTLESMLKHTENKDLVINLIFIVEKKYALTNIVKKYVKEKDFNKLIKVIFPQMDKLVFDKFNNELSIIRTKDEKLKFLLENLDFLNSKSKSIWVKENEIPEWEILFNCAKLCLRINQALKEVEDFNLVNKIIEKYIESYWEIDSNYRKIQSSPYIKNPEKIEIIFDLIMEYYFEFLRKINLKFTSFFEELKELNLKPLNSINQFSKILKKNEKKAIFVIDALRYELGMELLNVFKDDFETEIIPYYTEIPSITKIGMTYMLNPSKIKINVKDEKLKIFESESSIDLSIKKNREKFIKTEFKIESFAWIKDILKMRVGDIKKKYKDSLIVFHTDIDSTGTDSQSIAFNKFSLILLDIAKSIRKIIDAEFENIYIFTDHGFLLLPEKLKDHLKVDISDLLTLIKKPRYAMGSEFPNNGRYNQFNIKNSQLKLITPNGINCFISQGAYNFLHGGISIQEIIIPFIKIKVKPKVERKINVKISPFDAVNNRIFKVQLKKQFPKTITPEIRNVKVFCEYEGKIVSTEPEYLVEQDGEVQLRLLSIDIPKGSEISLKVQDVDTLEILDWINVKLNIHLMDDL